MQIKLFFLISIFLLFLPKASEAILAAPTPFMFACMDFQENRAQLTKPSQNTLANFLNALKKSYPDVNFVGIVRITSKDSIDHQDNQETPLKIKRDNYLLDMLKSFVQDLMPNVNTGAIETHSNSDLINESMPQEYQECKFLLAATVWHGDGYRAVCKKTNFCTLVKCDENKCSD